MVGLCTQIEHEAVMTPMAWCAHVEREVAAVSHAGVERVVMMGCLRSEDLKLGLTDVEMEAQYQCLH